MQKTPKTKILMLEYHRTEEPPKSDRWLIWTLSIVAVVLIIGTSAAIYFLQSAS